MHIINHICTHVIIHAVTYAWHRGVIGRGRARKRGGNFTGRYMVKIVGSKMQVSGRGRWRYYMRGGQEKRERLAVRGQIRCPIAGRSKKTLQNTTSLTATLFSSYLFLFMFAHLTSYICFRSVSKNITYDRNRHPKIFHYKNRLF